jgi:hypothetical protein
MLICEQTPRFQVLLCMLPDAFTCVCVCVCVCVCGVPDLPVRRRRLYRLYIKPEYRYYETTTNISSNSFKQETIFKFPPPSNLQLI